jgi:hypothetical protein
VDCPRLTMIPFPSRQGFSRLGLDPRSKYPWADPEEKQIGDQKSTGWRGFFYFFRNLFPDRSLRRNRACDRRRDHGPYLSASPRNPGTSARGLGSARRQDPGDGRRAGMGPFRPVEGRPILRNPVGASYRDLASGRRAGENARRFGRSSPSRPRARQAGRGR